MYQICQFTPQIPKGKTRKLFHIARGRARHVQQFCEYCLLHWCTGTVGQSEMHPMHFASVENCHTFPLLLFQGISVRNFILCRLANQASMTHNGCTNECRTLCVQCCSLVANRLDTLDARSDSWNGYCLETWFGWGNWEIREGCCLFGKCVTISKEYCWNILSNKCWKILI